MTAGEPDSYDAFLAHRDRNAKYVAEQAKREEFAILRRLALVRWLVRTGRLTEQTVKEQEPAQEHEDPLQQARAQTTGV